MLYRTIEKAAIKLYGENNYFIAFDTEINKYYIMETNPFFFIYEEEEN